MGFPVWIIPGKSAAIVPSSSVQFLYVAKHLGTLNNDSHLNNLIPTMNHLYDLTPTMTHQSARPAQPNLHKDDITSHNISDYY